MFIVERPGFKLTESFYYVAIVLLIFTFPIAMLTMHIHFNPSPKRKALPKIEPAPAELPQSIPECDLPPLPDRQGPYNYNGHPYYLYPNGDVDGFTQTWVVAAIF